LSKAKIEIRKIDQIMFGGKPDSEMSTTFQKFMDHTTMKKVDSASDWKVIGRIKIKPPANGGAEKPTRVEKIYLDQISAHQILKVLPTLPSIC
jgi:hypothetical protein